MKSGSEEIYWILIALGEEKNTCWVVTDANVSWIVWFELLWMENTYASVFLLKCVSFSRLVGAEAHSRAKAAQGCCTFSSTLHYMCQPPPCIFTCTRLLTLVNMSFWGRWSEGEEALHATHHRAPRYRLVSSKSSGTPLGKMRGLITVKLANEQVNYRAKFLCKDCHFSKRRSCLKSLK